MMLCNARHYALMSSRGLDCLVFQDNDASLVVFRFDDMPTAGTYRWVLLAWVPDTAKVRDKMLYSSSRDDLKRALGLGYFVTEYYANSKVQLGRHPQVQARHAHNISLTRVLMRSNQHQGDLSFAAVLESVNKDREDAPLTEAERLKREEVRRLLVSSEHLTH
jgi:hypothetical protein